VRRLLWVVAGVAAGCASTPQVHVQQAEGGVDRCTTFAWHAPGERPASFTEQRARDEVLRTLESKGYTIVDDQADCRIAFTFSARERPRSGPRVGVGAGGGSGGIGGGIGVSLPVGRGYMGTMTLDVIDAAQNAQIWSGTLESAMRSADPQPEDLSRDIQQILAAFPDRRN